MVYLGSHFNVGRSEVVLSSTSDSSISRSSSNSSSCSDLNPLCSTSESSSRGSRSSSNSGAAEILIQTISKVRIKGPLQPPKHQYSS
ncbi:uncharacterized protein LOC136026436 isoform X3 [Artemia franciscana]|uniref:uncharacterized protein LOC136026436 isoform X3 n=1 Tax=Artemia franciscana TaxID=6661 RepID=UPI0032DA116C